MFRIAYVTAPQAGQRWTLMKQCGVEAAVGGINPRPKVRCGTWDAALELSAFGRSESQI